MIVSRIIICPNSVAVWIKELMSEKYLMCPVITQNEYKECGLGGLLNCYSNLEEVIIISSHESLEKDWSLSESFKRIGIRVNCQSLIACYIGTNKIKMKELFSVNNIPTTDWNIELTSAFSKYVVKRINGTMGIGMRCYDVINGISLDNEFVELFEDGLEFSLNMYSDTRGNCVVYPPVCKGRTSETVIHPYKKIRYCCNFEMYEKYIQQMVEISQQVGKLIDNVGFMEAEFILNDKHQVKLLEVNPRVSGTLRMSSIASQNMCFDMLLNNNRKDYKAILKCISPTLEIPYYGDAKVDRNKDIICTSRATIPFSCEDELVDKIYTVKRMEAEKMIKQVLSRMSNF